MSRKRSHGRVSFNPIVTEKRLENGLSDDDEEEEEEEEEVDEEEVAKELEMESGEADEAEEEETPTLTAREAKTLAGKFMKMKKANDTGFKKDQIILVRPDGVSEAIIDPESLWKAKVIQARKNEGGKIFIEVRWFYSAEQTSALHLPAKAKFRPHRVCGKHELIETNHGDILSRDSFVSLLSVHRLTDDPKQTEIADGDWYTRASYSLKSKAFKVSTAPCQICHDYYRPESPRPEDLQAYCPNCHKWYHHGCLEEKGRHMSQDEFEQDLTKLLATNLLEPVSQPPSKRRRKDLGPKSSTSPSRKGAQATAELRAQRDLRRIAGTRIVRGGGFGITGTVKQICTARRILSELESGNISRLLDTDWKQEVGAALVKDSKGWPESTEFCYSCPNCKQAI